MNAGYALINGRLKGLVLSFLYHGDEIEVSVTGTTEEEVKHLAITKGLAFSGLALKSLKVIARLKSSDGIAETSLKVYHDGGSVPDLILTLTSATYEEKTGKIDVRGWANGRHTIEIKLSSDTPGQIAYNELLEIWTG